MATAKSTRAGKAHPRIPKSKRKPAALSKATADAVCAVRNGASNDVLRDIRRKLEVVMAVVCVSAAALRAQRADDDAEVALCLQRCAGDEIDRQIEQLDTLLEGGAS